MWSVQRDKREGRQFNLMDLIKSILAHLWISSPQFLSEKGVQRFITVEGKIPATIIIRRSRNLVAGEYRGVISVVGERVLELGKHILIRLTCRQECAEEGTSGIVLNVELDADSLKVRLHNQLIGGTPGIIGCRRVYEL